MEHLSMPARAEWLVLVALALAGCGERIALFASPVPVAVPVEEGDERAESPAVPRWALRFYDGYTADVLGGDRVAARAAYQAVVDAPEADGELTARAALRLAEMEAAAGRRHVALDLVVRAAALGRRDPAVLDGARRLQARIAAVRAQDIEVRGPPAGTALDGVSAAVAAQFARAEALLAAYHRRTIRVRLEDLNNEIRAKRAAMEEAVRAYRPVVQAGEPVGVVAAEFRIAGLFYDLSLSMTFDLPSELDAGAAARLRQSLRTQALKDRRTARLGYRKSLAAAAGAGPAARPWEQAAVLGLRSVDDLLGG